MDFGGCDVSEIRTIIFKGLVLMISILRDFISFNNDLRIEDQYFDLYQIESARYHLHSVHVKHRLCIKAIILFNNIE